MSNLILRRMNVKKYALAMVIVVLLAAGYSKRSDAAACATTTCDVYLALNFTCDIGDKTFSNFTFSSTGGAPASADVAVTPVLGPPLWGFLFAFGLASSSALTPDLQIGYTVTCNSLAPVFDCITSNHLTFNGEST